MIFNKKPTWGQIDYSDPIKKILSMKDSAEKYHKVCDLMMMKVGDQVLLKAEADRLERKGYRFI